MTTNFVFFGRLLFSLALLPLAADFHVGALSMAGSVHVAYFDRFPNFEQNLQASFISEFHRLAISQGWRKHKKRYKDERIRCVREHYDAYLGQVERGGQEEKLVKLQGLCMELLVDPAQTITQCKKVTSIKESKI